MMEVKEVKRWLNTIPDEMMIGVDDGGLSLSIIHPLALVETGEYCEIGGIPTEEEAEENHQ